ncbi:signal peptidase I [Acidimicrobiia bacterium EGI L10123]|uniref:signal peptidase I n=1 Tax=Salinilacustrithrix flava TaxID=2957203 RepID=UPI003D7C3169|nr:signal peptidase I [Acidimicrobiia bacterium EGI L10123]
MRMRRLLALALVGLITAGVLVLASGRVGYVSTAGVSMEPTYSAGDLVLVSRDGDYGVGDAVAYRDPGTGATVLHRIIGGGGAEGFVLQGDNNESIDPHEPTADELTGRAIGHVPAVGGVLGSPAAKGAITLAVAGLVGSLALPSHTKARTMAAHLAPKARKDRHRRAHPRVRRVWLASLVVDAVLVAGVLAAFSLRPTPAGAEPPADAEPLEHHVELGYGADVASTDTYPDGRIETGDTVFRMLADEAEVFARTVGPDGVVVDGFVQLDLTVSSSAGWSRTAPLVERTELDGDLDLTSAIPFFHMDRLAERITSETGVSAGTLDLTVTLVGEAHVGDSEPVDLEATLPLRLGPQTLTLSGAETTDTDDSPAVTSTVELPVAPADDEPVEERPDLTRPALGALLLGVGITAVVWPTGDEEDDPDAVVRIRTTELYHPLSASSVEVADAADVEGIARHAHAPILCRDDGWQGVVSDDVLYWTPPPVP